MVFTTSQTEKQELTERLQTAVDQDKKVLWLVSGGSNITLQVEVMAALKASRFKKLANLTILPMDERFGLPNHKDSNYMQMKLAGFDSGKAEWINVLRDNLGFSETIKKYADLASSVIKHSDSIIASFGIGADGHTAGILPKSPAVLGSDSVVGYQANDFMRLTMTPAWLAKVSSAVVVARGENKKLALLRLQQNNESIIDLPSMLLYKIKDTLVFNDFLESGE